MNGIPVQVGASGISREVMREVIETYFDGCNEVDAAKITACFAEDAVHYFPEGTAYGTFAGAAAIAEGWRRAVDTLGSVWTIDAMLFDEAKGEAAIEWTHFKPNLGCHLRGVEWYQFRPDGRIGEIRAYYAATFPDPTVTRQLGGFDYAGRGYALHAPEVESRGRPRP